MGEGGGYVQNLAAMLKATIGEQRYFLSNGNRVMKCSVKFSQIINILAILSLVLDT